jgi:hypothetical protein
MEGKGQNALYIPTLGLKAGVCEIYDIIKGAVSWF